MVGHFLRSAGICCAVAAIVGAAGPPRAQAAPGTATIKVSGFANVALAAGEGGGEEGEVGLEVTPQLRTAGGTALAARVALGAAGLATPDARAYRSSLNEWSLFAIGSFGRIEVGARAGFPQSLVGFTPSDIAFTTVGFGPESGRRLDPNGGLPTAFLPRGLGSRIDALTYLGYAARLYGDASPRIIYLSPRSRGGFYAAVSYAPRASHSGGVVLAQGGQARDGTIAAAGRAEPWHDLLQAAAVWNRRTETVDLSIGGTFSTARRAAPDASPGAAPRSSLSGGASIVIRDSLGLGLSATLDSPVRGNGPAGRIGTVRPFGVVASADYIAGRWAFGGYVQHAEGAAALPGLTRDRVDIGELGLSCLADANHDLLGPDRYTDVRLFAALYAFRFRSDRADERSAGTVALAGARLSFF